MSGGIAAIAFEGLLVLAVLAFAGWDLIATRRSMKRDREKRAPEAASTEPRHPEGK